MKTISINSTYPQYGFQKDVLIEQLATANE